MKINQSYAIPTYLQRTPYPELIGKENQMSNGNIKIEKQVMNICRSAGLLSFLSQRTEAA